MNGLAVRVARLGMLSRKNYHYTRGQALKTPYGWHNILPRARWAAPLVSGFASVPFYRARFRAVGRRAVAA